MNIYSLLRENIKNLTPYSSARTEFSGKGEIFLDANENCYDITKLKLNRYPDPLSLQLREQIALRNGVKSENIVVGNGSDEIIDNLIRMFCEPKIDSIILFPPTYGAYSVFAEINNVNILNIPLKNDFSLPALSEKNAKLLFICAPNNPTGNDYPLEIIEKYIKEFKGIVVVDEAYKDFSKIPSSVSLISKYSNLVVMKTFSKAWALAGARVGYMVASKDICTVMLKMKHPYNMSSITQNAALTALRKEEIVKHYIEEILIERQLLIEKLSKLNTVKTIYPSESNFLLIKVSNSEKIYKKLQQKSIVVRNRSIQLNFDCLRVSIGTKDENECLIKAWEEIENEK